MKIRRMQITIEPRVSWDVAAQFRVMVVTGSGTIETVEQFSESHFESAFDYMMDNAKRKIKDEIKLQKLNEIVHTS